MSTTTYTVKNIRVILADEKRKNEGVLFSVKGDFFDADGKPLSIKSKDITDAMAKSPDFKINLAKNTLTIPAGKRGRPATSSASQNEIDALLTKLKD